MSSLAAQTMPAAPGAVREPVRASFMLRVFVVFACLALLSVAISVAGKWAGRSIALAGHTDSRAVHEVVIGNDVLALPANAIRFEASRRDGVAARIDLYLRWPDLEGYREDVRDDFNHAGGSRSILFLTIDERIMSRDMSGRLGPIYDRVIVQPGRRGPAGLTVHEFLPGTGYVDEVLVVGQQEGVRPFVARCLSGAAAADSLAPCERDVHVGRGLSLTYRFPAGLAEHWRELDAAVRARVEGFIQSTP